jgi:trehalose-6-phosphate synthase
MMSQTIKDFFNHVGIDVNALKEKIRSESIQNTNKKKVASIKKRYKNPKTS